MKKILMFSFCFYSITSFAGESALDISRSFVKRFASEVPFPQIQHDSQMKAMKADVEKRCLEYLQGVTSRLKGEYQVVQGCESQPIVFSGSARNLYIYEVTANMSVVLGK